MDGRLSIGRIVNQNVLLLSLLFLDIHVIVSGIMKSWTILQKRVEIALVIITLMNFQKKICQPTPHDDDDGMKCCTFKTPNLPPGVAIEIFIF